ncbi:MAG: hypothetical protein ACE5IH_00820 [Thermodesulfobacteriota bacterium]
MNIINPIPASSVLLVLFLPFIWYLGQNLVNRVIRIPLVLFFLAPGVSLSIWLLLIHLFGRLSGSFVIGLRTGTLFCALIGVVFLLKNKRNGIRLQLPSWKGYYGLILVTAITAMVLILPLTLKWHIHDETNISGHMAIISQIQNDSYPPRNMTFATIEHHYHYGFDLLSAVITALIRVPVDVAIDIVTLLLWGYTWCLLWVVGDRLLGLRRGYLTALSGLLGSGVPYLYVLLGFSRSDSETLISLIGDGYIGGARLNGSIISYFFQHPWALGLPVALCALLIYMERETCSQVYRYLLLAFLLIFLSLSQIVLFLTFTGSMLISELISVRESGKKRLIITAGVFCGIVLVASQIGGFFSPMPEGSELPFRISDGIANTIGSSIIWNLVCFGFLLPFGIIGLWFLTREKVFFAVLTFGSLMVLNGLEYKSSWDIVKFGNAASIALAILSSVMISRLLNSNGKLIKRIFCVVSIIAVTAAGFSYAIVMGLKPEALPTYLEAEGTVSLSKEDVEVVNWLRTRVNPGELVYRRGRIGLGYAQWGGLPRPDYDWGTLSWGFPEEMLRERAFLLDTLPFNPDWYLRIGLRWFVLDTPDYRLNRHFREWEKMGKAALQRKIGDLRVYKLI